MYMHFTVRTFKDEKEKNDEERKQTKESQSVALKSDPVKNEDNMVHFHLIKNYIMYMTGL